MVLWVRSYYRSDDLRVPVPATQTLSVKSFRGRFVWLLFDIPQGHEFDLIVGAAEDVRDWTEYDAYIGNWHWIQVGAKLKALVLPHWLFAVLSVVFAAIPWLPWRFSLRTLLIATRLVAAVLGLIVAVL
jgi:hypothetical protein